MQSGFKITDPNCSATLPAEKYKYSYGKKNVFWSSLWHYAVMSLRKSL